MQDIRTEKAYREQEGGFCSTAVALYKARGFAGQYMQQADGHACFEGGGQAAVKLGRAVCSHHLLLAHAFPVQFRNAIFDSVRWLLARFCTGQQIAVDDDAFPLFF